MEHHREGDCGVALKAVSHCPRLQASSPSRGSSNVGLGLKLDRLERRSSCSTPARALARFCLGGRMGFLLSKSPADIHRIKSEKLANIGEGKNPVIARAHDPRLNLSETFPVSPTLSGLVFPIAMNRVVEDGA